MRYQHASEMETDFSRTRRDTGSPMGGTDVRKATLRFAEYRRSYGKIAVLGGIIVACLMGVFLWLTSRRSGSAGVAGLNSIAVLPLQNLNGDTSVDYLRFALADEIANQITYSRMDVRPSIVTRKYVNRDLDPQKVGLELHVGTVLTGHL